VVTLWAGQLNLLPRFERLGVSKKRLNHQRFDLKVPCLWRTSFGSSFLRSFCS
jgi:hypothetical protein